MRRDPEVEALRERIAELEKALRWVRDGQDQGGSYIHAMDCNCVVCSLLSGETPKHERWAVLE
jgi:hypothetical protein